jgi:hypothetical protein
MSGHSGPGKRPVASWLFEVAQPATNNAPKKTNERRAMRMPRSADC